MIVLKKLRGRDDRWIDMYVRQIITKLQSLWVRDEGASLVEYSLLIALIAVIALVAMRFFGTELSTSYSDIAQSVADNT